MRRYGLRDDQWDRIKDTPNNNQLRSAVVRRSDSGVGDSGAG